MGGTSQGSKARPWLVTGLVALVLAPLLAWQVARSPVDVPPGLGFVMILAAVAQFPLALLAVAALTTGLVVWLRERRARRRAAA